MSLGLGLGIGLGGGGASSAPFVPTSIAGNVLWLRADLGVTTSGGNITTWADQSGGGNTATAMVTTQQATVVTGASGINSQPAVNFPAGAGSVYFKGVSNLVASGSDRTLFVVLKAAPLATVNLFVFKLLAPTYIVRYDSTADTFSDGATFNDVGTYTADANAHILMAQGHLGSVSPYVLDGATITQTAPHNMTSDSGATAGWSLGASATGTAAYNGLIAEVIVYNSVLNAQNIATVRAYLKGRYATP